MNFFCLILGAVILFVIWIGHIIVIKGEFYFGTKIWPLFLLIGITALLISLLVKNNFVSGLLAVIGFIFLWAILELFEQKQRTDKGWFPKNPRRRY